MICKTRIFSHAKLRFDDRIRTIAMKRKLIAILSTAIYLFMHKCAFHFRFSLFRVFASVHFPRFILTLSLMKCSANCLTLVRITTCAFVLWRILWTFVAKRKTNSRQSKFDDSFDDQSSRMKWKRRIFLFHCLYLDPLKFITFDSLAIDEMSLSRKTKMKNRLADTNRLSLSLALNQHQFGSFSWDTFFDWFRQCERIIIKPRHLGRQSRETKTASNDARWHSTD